MRYGKRGEVRRASLAGTAYEAGAAGQSRFSATPCSDRDSGRRRSVPAPRVAQRARNLPGVMPVVRRKAAPKALAER